jgi:hypothetical protein
LGPKACLSTSPLILPLKQRTPRPSREPATNYAAAFGTWSMTSGTSPLIARPSASVAWLWRHQWEVNVFNSFLTPYSHLDLCP